MAANEADLVRESWLKWALYAFNQAEEDYQSYEDYYVGDHELEFATVRWAEMFGTIFEEMSDNWCGVVVDSLAQRLEIIGWQTDGDKADAKLAEEIWDRDWLANEEEDLTTHTLVKGDGYLMIWPRVEEDRPEEVGIYYNDALDMNVYYDPQFHRQATRAAKKFQDEDGNMHIYIYYQDHYEHYLSETNTPNPFHIVQFETVSETLPAGWKLVKSSPNPFGELPIFHFRNKMANSTHGISELKQVIPMQNATNKLLMDMMIASEFGGYRQKWMAGGGHPADGWKAGPERIWATTDSNARFGEFGQTDIEPYTRVIEMVIGQIAKITQTPMHYLRSSGDMPSGEALKTAESGLIYKAKNRQKQFGTQWAKAMTFAVGVEKGKGNSLVELKAPLTPVWKSPETRHDLEQAQTAQLKSVLGIPLEQLWSEHFGYSEEQIAQFKKENKAIAAQVLAGVLAQIGQLPPGAESLAGVAPQDLIKLIQGGMSPSGGDRGPVDISGILALLPKGVTAQTTAGEATTKPQPHSSPPGSPTRKSSGFKD